MGVGDEERWQRMKERNSEKSKAFSFQQIHFILIQMEKSQSIWNNNVYIWLQACIPSELVVDQMLSESGEFYIVCTYITTLKWVV